MHTYGGEEIASLNLNLAPDVDHCSRFRLSLYPQAFKAKWYTITCSFFSKRNATSLSAGILLDMEAAQW